MGPPGDSQVISTEFQRDGSGVGSEGYDNYPPADEFSRFDTPYFMKSVGSMLEMISVSIVMKVLR